MRVPATINKLFSVVEYCHLPEPVLVSGSRSLLGGKLVQEVAICTSKGRSGHTPVFCTEEWQSVPSGLDLTLEEWECLTLDQAKELARTALGQSRMNWQQGPNLTATDFYGKKLEQPNSVEALAWMQTEDGVFRTFGGNGIRKGYNGKRAVSYIKRLYRRGAVAVTAVEVQRDRREWVRQESIQQGLPETEIIEATDELIVELPVVASARAELIEQWIATFGRKMWDVPTDTGQNYLYFRWD